MTTECSFHREHAWIVRCAHWGSASITQRDYKHPDYVFLFGEEWREARFGVFGLQEQPFMLLVDVETDDRAEADAAFNEAVERMTAGVA